jgi:hypothetical protein
MLSNLGVLDVALMLAVLALTFNDWRLARHFSKELWHTECGKASTSLVAELRRDVKAVKRSLDEACERHDLDYNVLRLQVELPDQDSYIRARRELVRDLHHDTTANQELLRQLVNLSAYGRRKGWEC